MPVFRSTPDLEMHYEVDDFTDPWRTPETVLMLHGTRDRLVPITVARAAARANPAWTMIEMPGVGHVPQLEAPDDTAGAIIGWLGAAG